MKTYTISPGTHDPRPRDGFGVLSWNVPPLVRLKKSALVVGVVFHDNCLYDFPDGDNHDWNKLPGVSLELFSKNENAVMGAWRARPDLGEIERSGAEIEAQKKHQEADSINDLTAHLYGIDQALASAGGDDLGNHTMTQNLETSGNWISNDGDNEGVFVTSNGDTGINLSAPDYAIDVDGGIGFRELSADPPNPDEGAAVMWMSDGTGSGDICAITERQILI